MVTKTKSCGPETPADLAILACLEVLKEQGASDAECLAAIKALLGADGDIVAKLCEILAALEAGITVTLSAESIAAIEALLGPLLIELQAINQNTDTLEALIGDINTNLAAIVAQLVALNAELNAQGDTLDSILELLQNILDALMAFCEIAITDVCSSVDGRPLLAQVIKAQTGGAPVYSLVEMDGSPVTDGSTAVACGVDREKVTRELCTEDGTKWLSCTFVNVEDPTDAIGPVFISPFGAIGTPPPNLRPCEAIEDLIKDCPVASQSLFQTYATSEYKIIGPILFGGEDISDKFTLPVDGNSLPALTAFRDELIGCLNARGINTTYIQGRDGWTIGWVGLQLTITQDPTNNVSTETVEEGRVLCVDSKRDPEILAALAAIKNEITCLKPDPECCEPPEGQMLSGAGSDTVTVAGDFSGASQLDVIEADGTTNTVAVTNAVYNAATNTTAATLQQATAVKAVKVQRRIIEGEGEG